jgi:hypothetical protein
MKTTNNVQKTENKKIERPVSKFFAVVLSLVLISLTVSANGFWKQLLTNNTFGKMAVLMVDQENENKELLAFVSPATIEHTAEINRPVSAFYIEPAQEKSLEIENWMTDETYFGSTILSYQVEREEPLEIESWMIDNNKFNKPAADNEPALKIEAWMLDENVWNN